MKILGAPVGFRFLPSDEETIGYLLDKLTTGNTLPNGLIPESQLYAEDEPWKEKFVEKGDSELFFFTKLRKAKTNKAGGIGGRVERSIGSKAGGIGGRVERSIGSKATWRSTKDAPILTANRVHIGSKKTFDYQPKTAAAAAGGRFTMVEYRLDGVLRNVCPEADDYVICCVRKKEQASAKGGEIVVMDFPASDGGSLWWRGGGQ